MQHVIEPLKTTIDSIVADYVTRSKRSRKYYERSKKVTPLGSHRGIIFYDPYPIYSERGEGGHIWDVDNIERIDYCFNYSSLLLGHSNPGVIRAIARELENGLGRGQPTLAEVELAEKICSLVPCAERVKFCVTGSEACMNAIRAARAYTGKNKIIAFEGAYHGSSDAVSVNGLAFNSAGILPEVQKNTIVVPFNDVNAFERTVRENRADLAAVLLEPILAAGGTVVPDLDFANNVAEIAHQFDSLLILDEIVTGFRISRGGWQQKYGVKPDLTTLGKNVSGGMPGAAIAGDEEVMEDVYGIANSKNSSNEASPKAHLSGTYNAFPLSMAAGLATLNQLSDDVYSRIDDLAEKLRDDFNKIASDRRINAIASGIGSIFQFHFTDEKKIDCRSAKRSNKKMRWFLDISLLNHGVYLAPGHFCVTSSSTTEDDVSVTLDSIEKAMGEIKSL